MRWKLLILSNDAAKEFVALNAQVDGDVALNRSVNVELAFFVVCDFCVFHGCFCLPFLS